MQGASLKITEGQSKKVKEYLKGGYYGTDTICGTAPFQESMG